MSFSGFRSSRAHQLVALEGAAGGAKLHLQQPLFAGDGVKEPAVRFLRRPDLDHAPRVPIGGTEEVGCLLDAIDHVGEDAAVPAAGVAGAADAGDGVPARGRRLARASWRPCRFRRYRGLGGGRPRRRRSRRPPAAQTARPPARGPAPRRCGREENSEFGSRNSEERRHGSWHCSFSCSPVPRAAALPNSDFRIPNLRQGLPGCRRPRRSRPRRRPRAPGRSPSRPS